MQPKHYDAFISYRHEKNEKKAAIRLQRLLEQMKLPNKRKLRIFRDQTELAAGNNLSDDIKDALAHSDYLIVLCSPTFSQSKYCMEELAYFRELHNYSNQRIIPVLVSGEPEEAFPEALTWEDCVIIREDGTSEIVPKAIEPLGADIRSEYAFVRHHKLRTEYLRVASKILDIPFDTLYQRGKRRKLMLYSIVISIVAALSVGFAVYNAYMTKQVTESHQALLANESFRLASESGLRMEAGDVNLAMLLALEAMPENLSDPERPLVQEAEAALRSSVLTRQWENTVSPLQHIAKLEFDTFDWHILGFYDGGRKIAISDWQEVSLYDAVNGMELFRCPAPFAQAYFSEDGNYVLIISSRDTGEGFFYDAVLYDTQSGSSLNQQTFLLDVHQYLRCWWDNSHNLCYILKDVYAQDADKVQAENAIYLLGKDGSQKVYPADYIEEYHFDEQQGSFGFSGAGDDYSRWDGVLSPRGEKYLSYIEKYWEEDYYGAQITEDEELLIFSKTYSDKYGSSVVYSLDMLKEGTRNPITIPGRCYADTEKHLLYGESEYALSIYSYNAEDRITRKRLGAYSLEEHMLLSSDGSRCFNMSSMVWDALDESISRSTDTEGLWIWDSSDLSVPLLEVFHDGRAFDPYYVSAELEYIFLQTREDTFQLWSIYDGCTLNIKVDAQLGAMAERVCVSADGSLLAVGYENGLVQVYSGKDGKLLTEIDCSENRREETSFDTIEHLEFEGSRLLITGSVSDNSPRGWSWIADISGKEEIIKIGDSCIEVYICTDQFLTSDGLLFCGGSYLPDTVDAVYDISTQEVVFEELAYYHYDEATGTLLYLLAHPGYTSNPVLYAARREDSGMFEQIYSLKPQAGEVKFTQDLYSNNSRYVMLASSKCAKIYEIETGEEALTIYYAIPDGAEQYGRTYLRFAENTIYDMRWYTGGKLVSYPLLPNTELVDTAWEYLKSDLCVRKLTEAERSRFFVEQSS